MIIKCTRIKEFTMKKKILALLLAIFAVVPLLVACGSSYYQYDSYLDFIKLGDPTKIEITEADIENNILKAYYEYFSDEISAKTITSTEHTSGEVKYGDTLNIDYKGFKIGETEAFEGGSATSQSLEIGSGSFIDGFESGLIGHEVGETVRLYLTFPDTYGSEELAGKRVYFDVKINKITARYKYPDMTDEVIKTQSAGEFETVDAFKKHAREDAIKNLIWADFYEASRVTKWPSKELRDYYDTSLEEHKNTATYLYGSLDSYASAMGYTNGEKLRAYIMQQARQQCKQDIIVLALVEKYDLKMSDAKLEKEMKKIYEEAKEQGFEGSYKKYLKEYDESAIRIAAYTDVVIDFLTSKTTTVNNLGKNGFFGKPENGIYYYVNGVKQTGWVRLDQDQDGTEEVYYFNPEIEGRAYHNVAVKMAVENGTELKYHKFGDKGLFKGIAENEIINDGNGYLFIKDNAPLTGLQKLDRTGEIAGEETYLFGEDGYMYIGVKKLENFGGIDFKSFNGKYYNFGSNGVFNINLETDTNGLYEGCTNALADGVIDGKYYKEGVMQVSTEYTDSTNNNKYYFDENGEMATNKFVTISDNKYYFGSDGIMVKGESADKPYKLTIENIVYTINENGVVVSEEPVPSEG